jgi:hypothetical protein
MYRRDQFDPIRSVTFSGAALQAIGDDARALALLTRILRYASRPDYRFGLDRADIEQWCACSEKTASRVVKRLREAGVIIVTGRPGRRGTDVEVPAWVVEPVDVPAPEWTDPYSEGVTDDEA